jgi:hypothetical protein
MALTFISQDSFPTYIISGSIPAITSGCPLEGANHIGKTVFVTGSPAWYIIDADLNLQPFTFPT